MSSDDAHGGPLAPGRTAGPALHVVDASAVAEALDEAVLSLGVLSRSWGASPACTVALHRLAVAQTQLPPLVSDDLANADRAPVLGGHGSTPQDLPAVLALLDAAVTAGHRLAETEPDAARGARWAALAMLVEQAAQGLAHEAGTACGDGPA